MSRTSRRTAAVKARKALETQQRKLSQGPQVPNHPAQSGVVQLDANLTEKYLGQGLLGLGPYLTVLDNRSANEIVCEHGYAILRKMLADSEVDASVDALIQAATSQPATFSSQIEEGEPGWLKAKGIADFVTYAFNQIPIDDWKKEQLRNTLAFGNGVSELDWDVVGEGQYEGKFIYKGLRPQRPEDYGFITDRWGTIFGVAPLGLASGTFFPLGNLVPLSTDKETILKGAVPRYKLAIWTWEQRGMDPRGTSILIPAYVPWWSKQRAIEEWSCWLGRYAQPSIWATPGPNAIPTCDPRTNVVTQPTEALLNALLNFRSGSALALPFGSTVQLLSASGSVEPFLKSIEMFNQEITRAILGQHLATAEGTTSSKPGAELHALVLRMLINSIRQYMLRQMTVELVRPLVQANYGLVEDKFIPSLSLGDDDGFPPSVTEVAVLFQAGYFTEDQLRVLDKRLGFPIRKTNNRVGASNLPPAPGQENDTNGPDNSKDPAREDEESGSTGARMGTQDKEPATESPSNGQGSS